jgi:uncharacterized repeat protein (TIGR03803 family)
MTQFFTFKDDASQAHSRSRSYRTNVKNLNSLVGGCLSAALLAACGGNTLSSSTPTSVAPQIAAPQSALGRYAPHRVGKNVQKETVLYSFAGAPSDGVYPYADLINVGGTLYGTTFLGGADNKGTVFASTTSGTETVLHSFTGGTDGAYPYAGLIFVGGKLYGTTESGGANNDGTVFKLTTSGTETVLYSFAGGTDGALPLADLVNVGGTLYGTTAQGGASGYGTIFALLGHSGPEFVLYSFHGGSDGAYPYAGLTNVGGTLYGTTYQGGASNDFGTVFSFSL